MKYNKNSLGIEKISDIRGRINFAKEYVLIKESQDGLNNLVKTILEGIGGLVEFFLSFFRCLSKFAQAFDTQPNSSKIKEQPQTTVDTDILMAEIEEILATAQVSKEEDINLPIYTFDEKLLDFFDINESIKPAQKVNHKEKNEIRDNIEIDNSEVKDITEKGITPVLVHILNQLWQYRFEVNPLSVYIIEIAYKFIVSNNDEEQKAHPKRELRELYLQDFKTIWRIISNKIQLNFSDSKDDLETNKNIFNSYISQIFEIAQGLAPSNYEETLALHLSHTPVFHIKDVLCYQEKKGQYEGNLKNLVKTIISEYSYLFVENQIREITDWIYETNSTTSNLNYAEPKITDKRLIVINKEYIMPIASAFVNYFDEADINIFLRLLEGEKIEGKIVFRGNSSQLVYGFRVLIDSKKNIISNQKKEVESWLINNFRFYSKDTKNIEDLKFDTVRAILSRSSTNEPRNAIEFSFDY